MSNNILETLSHVLDDNALNALSSQLGADRDTTERAVSAALPTLLGAVARQADSPQQANAFESAIQRDHDGSVLDNVHGFLNGGGGAGSAILGHLLGGRQNRVEKGVSQMSGLDSGSTSKLLAMLAPLVMGAIGKQAKSGQIQSGGLTDLLRQQRSHAESAAPTGLLGRLLDADGDGDFDLSDIMKHGTGLLGSFFRRR
ncbi:MAG: DUF937 domain-containing protein [Planctomycetales bacterium]|nr:DUF937 domain-containing protein [Planctomycetales bacterium]